MINKVKYIFIQMFYLFIISNPVLLAGTDWCDIYFTAPSGRDEYQLNRKNPEIGLVTAIKNAKKNFYGAFYDLSSKPVIDEIKEAMKRGVEVRLVIEEDNYIKAGIKEFRNSGIAIVTDGRRGLMHNKFAIIDEEIIWTGSYNTTYNGAYKNNNNAIKIISKELADIYILEFDEMFVDQIFGNKKENIIFPLLKKKHYCIIGTSGIEVYFSPEDDIERIIIKRLMQAKKTVHFMAFSFTSDKIADGLIHLHKNGIKISGIFEKVGSNSKYSKYNKLRLEGINVKTDRNKYNMHHKVIVIDDRLLITGSYNFSKNANEKNDENIIIIDNKIIAAEYLEEFFKLF